MRSGARAAANFQHCHTYAASTHLKAKKSLLCYNKTLLLCESDVDPFRSDCSVTMHVSDINYAANNPLGVLSRKLSRTWPSKESMFVKYVSFVNNFVCFSAHLFSI